MARKEESNKPEANEAPATSDTTEATESKTAAPTEPSLTPEERAKILADKQAAGQLGKVWKMKGGTDIPARFDANEAQQYEAKIGATPAETMANMLVFAGGDQQAVLDSFNAAHRLAAQKRAKDLMDAPETTLADVQEELHSYTSGSKRRGSGKTSGAVKEKLAKAEATVAAQAEGIEAMLKDLEAVNPEAAAKYRERLAAVK